MRFGVACSTPNDMTTARRFTCLFTDAEWARVCARLAELKTEDARSTYSDVIRQLVRTLPSTAD